jgi:hypothetical protein
MRKENEFGGVYHQMNFSRDELVRILYLLDNNDTPMFSESWDLEENLIDRIEKELGIE